MDRKRELTSVDVRALAGELGRYEGAKVDKVYLYGDDLLRFKLRDFDHGRVELLVEVGDPKRVHVTDPDRVPPAPDRPPEFAKTLRSHIAGGEFAGVDQFEFDRILRFRFERPDGNTTVVAELFGDGNVAVLDENREVLRSLETVRLKSRTVAPGTPYEYPASRLNPLDASYDAFVAGLEESDADVVRTLATRGNFGGLWAEELCSRASVDKSLHVTELSDDDYRALYDAVNRLSDRLSAGDLDPRLYETSGDDGTEGTVVDATPFPMEEYAGLAATAFDDFDAALDEYFHRFHQADEEEEESGLDRPDFAEQIATKERIIDQQEGAIAEFDEQADRERRRAELLYANYDLVDEICDTVRSARDAGKSWDEIEATLDEGAERGIAAAEAVVDVNGDAGTVTVELDDEQVPVHPEDGVEKNADRLYQEAKRVESKKEGAQEAIENTRAELDALRERKRRWEDADGHPDREDGSAGEGDGEGDEGAGTDGRDGDAGNDDEAIDWLSRTSVPVRTTEEWYERFRWFHTSDGFLVIGGRNADQNEEIVKKYMDSSDLFFHSQAHGGPATVLKATGPSEPARDVEIPERSREEAARFAVSYSSVWKDGRHAGEAYQVTPDQVSKTPESGEYLEKGGFVIRGDRTYYRDVPARVAVGIQAEDVTQVIGGPPEPIAERSETVIELEPGKFAQNDAAVKCYREFKRRFADDSFVRKVASADRIQEFLPPGGSDLLGV